MREDVSDGYSRINNKNLKQMAKLKYFGINSIFLPRASVTAESIKNLQSTRAGSSGLQRATPTAIKRQWRLNNLDDKNMKLNSLQER
ncbi:unnamed protein product [Clavelina lepadiformis]|uniref:Uncharacterized protein n=1 Tax=Clavelina lepadiformis TaxID=159417 RepID=A0ABP0EWX2_CLALP